MPDLEKTIQAMECCLNRNYFSKCPPACPYNGTEQDGACGRIVLNDALELLKEAEKNGIKEDYIVGDDEYNEAVKRWEAERHEDHDHGIRG